MGCLDLVNRSILPLKRAIEDSKIDKSDIRDVILVGGQTRMPLVQEKVAEFFGKKPRKDVNPDEAVALGAAIQAGVLSGNVKDILLLDVTPLSMGIETQGDIMTPMIAKNTTIPAKRAKSKDNKTLGTFTLGGIRPAPKGRPQIEVTFDIDANGILKVTAKDKDTGRQHNITIESSSGLTDAQIEGMVKEAQLNKAADDEFQELVKVRNQADSVLHDIRSQMTEKKSKISESEASTILKSISDLENANNQNDTNKINSKMQECIKHCNRLGEIPMREE